MIFSVFYCSFLGATTFALNGTILWLVKEHIKYGVPQNGNSSSIQKTPSTATGSSIINPPTTLQITHILQLQQLSQQQLSESLISQLEIVGNPNARALVLQKYFTTSTSLIQALQKALEQEKIILTAYQEKIKLCESEVTTLNADFQRAVKQYEWEKAEQIVKQIVEKRTCVAENTVYYKEHFLYNNMLQSSFTVLTKRLAYLQQQQDAILQYYDIMKPELLKELYTISQTIQANF